MVPEVQGSLGQREMTMHTQHLRTSVRVDYSHTDGWHVFRSDQISGLYIASEDAERAFNDVSAAIKLLVELDFGVECRVERELSFAEFRRAAMGHVEQTEPPMTRLSSQSYSVHTAAA